LRRRNKIVVGATSAVAATAIAAVPAGAGGDSVTGELGGDSAKRAPLVLDLIGTTANDTITVSTFGGGVRAAVPAPATITGPPACDQDTPQQFTCDATVGVDAVRGRMGPGGDRFNARQYTKLTNQYGGAGNDVLKGGTKFDFFNGQGGGNDRCRGGRGKETLKKCE